MFSRTTGPTIIAARNMPPTMISMTAGQRMPGGGRTAWFAAGGCASPTAVVACGGVGNWDHLAEGIEAGASAVAAANIFHYTENSVRNAKQHLVELGLPVRPFEAVTLSAV